MKKIEFRGKCLNSGNWVYGYYIFHSKRTGWFGQQVTEHDVDKHLIYSYKANASWEIDPATVGQNINIKDDHGEEIWVHDIVNVKIRDYVWNKVIVDRNVVIKFKDGRFGFEWGGEFGRKEFASFNEFDKSVTSFTRIGNKFDNPELLEMASA